MLLRKYLAIKIVIWFLTIKTYLASSDCYYPTFELSSKTSQSLNRLWYQNPQCHAKGIFMEVDFYTPNFSVIGIDKNIKITNLQINRHYLPNMEENMFNAEVFKSVKKLTYITMKAKLVVKGALNGLESLKILNIKNDIVETIEKGFLDALNNTLEEFTFIEQGLTEKGIKVDQFFGSAQLTKLENVTIKYKIENLTRNSFSGLTNVKYLDLSNSRIEFIGAGTFDPISTSIEYLNLGGNHFTTVPSGLFDLMLQSNVKRIDIQSHEWTCDCDLLPLKTVLSKYSDKFPIYIQCKKPIQLKHEFVHKADLCKSETTTPTTSYQPISTSRPTHQTEITSEPLTEPFTSTSTSEVYSEATVKSTSESTTIPPLNQLSLYCYSSKRTDFKVKPHGLNIVIKDHKLDSIIVYFDVLNENSTFVWFSGQKETYVSTIGRCSIGDRAHVVVNDLKENSIYMFCITYGMEIPYNCFSYTKHRRSYLHTWLFENTVAFVIGMIFICSLTILLLITLVRKTRQRTNYSSILASQGFASITSPFNKDLNKTYGTIETT